MNPVQAWAAQVPETLAGLWGQPLRPTDLTDDRLAEVARQLSRAEAWQPLEQPINQRQIRVYDLRVEQVRQMPYILAIPTPFRRALGAAEALGGIGLILPALTHILPGSRRWRPSAW